MKYIIQEEFRKGGCEIWDESFDSYEEAKSAVINHITEDGENSDSLESYNFYEDGWHGEENSYEIHKVK